MDPFILHVDGLMICITSEIHQTLSCSLCSNILSNPYHSPCGCRFCFECIRNHLKDNDKVCPGKTDDCLEGKLNLERDIRLDVLGKREVNKLMAKCPLYLCDDESEVRKIKDHIKVCGSMNIKCKTCNEDVRRSEYKNHERNECIKGLVNCEFCNMKMMRNKFQEEHFNYEQVDLCSQYTNYCPNECGEQERVMWIKHRLTCKKKYMECPYKNLGCTSTTLESKEMSLHITKNGFDHAEMLFKLIGNLQNEISHLKHEFASLNNEMRKVKEICEEQIKEIELQKGENIILNNTISNGKKSNLDILTKSSQNRKVKRSESVDHLITSEIVRDKLVTSGRRITRKEVERNKTLFEMGNFSGVEDKSMNCSRKEEHIGLNADVCLAQSISKAKEIVLVWAVTNFSQIHEIVSPHFFTHSMGYKMDLSLEKKIKNYLSIYGRLHCGEYDGELSWPFKGKLTIRILDQEKLGRDYEKVINFNRKAARARERIYTCVTIGYGFHEFISYVELRQKPYLLRKNSLWIHCLVDGN